MLLRQLFYYPIFGFTYVLADSEFREGILIDPVKSRLRDYVQLFNELGLTLTATLSTHTHDDRESPHEDLRSLWNCETMIGAPNDPGVYTRILQHGDTISVGMQTLYVIHTPGHTLDSYCFYLDSPDSPMLFTGDTLLVRNVGLSDQDTSNPKHHFHSLHYVLSELPEETIVYPGRDFKGWPVSTLREERAFNPYLLAQDLEEFLALKALQEPADINPLMADRREQEEEEEFTLDHDSDKDDIVEAASQLPSWR